MAALLFAIYVVSALAARSGKGGPSSLSSLGPPMDEAAWQGIKITDVMPGFRVKDLKLATKCSRQVRRGDAVRVFLRAQTGPQHEEQATSKDDAEQNFIVGKHSIPAINKGMIGMCPGSLRRITVESHAIDYMVNLTEIESGPLRIKEAL